MEADLTLYSNVESSGLASLYQRNLQHFGISMDKSEKIKLSTIDSLLQTKWPLIESFLKWI